MIKVSLNDILNSNNIFREISNKTLPVKTAFRIARIIRELDKENATFDEARRKIINKYADYDENGNIKQTDEGNIIIKQECIDACNNEIIELLNTIVEINVEKLHIDDLGDLELTPAQSLSLDAFVDE